MNFTTLFAYLRRAPFGNSLSQSQVDGVNAIVSYALARNVPLAWIAYILATAYHETGGTFKPGSENLNYTTIAALRAAFKTPFKDKPDAFVRGYLKSPEKLANYVYANKLGNTAKGDGWLYRGRGMVQLTFKDNYAKFGLAGNPDGAMQIDNAVRIIVDGMLRGSFTGLKLKDFGVDTFGAVGARAIVSSDKASLIATYYKSFYDALQFASAKGDAAPKETETELSNDAKPDDVSAFKSPIAQAVIGSVGSGGALSVVAGITNPYAFVFLGVVVVIGALFAWGYFSGRINFKRT
jgi:putative chitinase